MNKDQQLRNDIIEVLDHEQAIDSAKIGVAAKNGIVTLTGSVPNHVAKRLAERLVRNLPGVKGIAEEIEVNLPDSSKRSDADIAAAAVHSLRWDVRIPIDSVKVKVEDGWLTLEGDVDYGYQRRAAEDTVHSIIGVKGVSNCISVKPFVKAVDVMEQIEASLKQNAEREAKNVLIETLDGTVTLRGTVRSWLERDEIGRAAWRSPGVSTVHNYLSVGT